MIGAGDTHLPRLDDPPITGPSRCRQTPRVTSSPPAQIVQLVPQDARPLSNALEALNFTQDNKIKCASEWSGVLSFERVYAGVGSVKRVAKAGHHLYL